MSDKIAVIICLAEQSEYEHIIEELQNAIIPEGYSVDIMVYPTDTDKAKNFNNAIHGTDAKYKIFFNSPVERINCEIFKEVVDYFTIEPNIGIMGILGSELPIDADYSNAEKIYGAYYKHVGDRYEFVASDNPLFYQSVSMLDSNFFATSSDLLFDENVGEFFLLPAYCSSLKQRGLKSIVVMQNENNLWMTLKEDCDYQKAHVDPRYKIQLEDFYRRYNKCFLPLVSILIPAYNNTVFLKDALESAIGQSYPNIEIMVGDDSTTDDVKLFIEPYLNNHDNITFYHHGGPLGGRGINNINFLLEKSNGEYIKLLFHDDVLTDDSIYEMMKYYIKDLDCKIGLVTSVREAIDEQGIVLGTVSPWIPNKDLIVPPEELIRKVLYSSYNFIGEYSTVLVRKRYFWVPELNSYRIGYYKGFIDRHMGDVSSWLMLSSKGLDCLFIKKRLSYFRLHRNQNTYNPNIQVGSILDWYSLCLLSYNYKGEYSQSDECFHIIKRMNEQLKVFNSAPDGDEEFAPMYTLYKKIQAFLLEGNKDMVFKLVEHYIKNNSVC